MAVVRREAWRLLFSLIAGTLIGASVMIYAAMQVNSTP
jgi:hypothetical protein